MPDTDLPGQIIGYRKNGTPIRLLAGGAPEEDPQDSGDTPKGTDRFFSQEQVNELIENARKQEKDKLYPQISKTDERSKAMQDELKELRAFQKKQEVAESKRLAEIEAERKRAEEAELSAKDLIERRQAEADARLQQWQDENSQQIVLMQKELEFTRLQAYTQRRINEVQDEIAPELLDLIDGSTPEEIEASIERMKAKTDLLVQNMRGAQVRQRAAMPGVAPSAGTNGVGPMDTPGDRQISDQDLANMGMKEYAALRAKLGFSGANNQGLFRM